MSAAFVAGTLVGFTYYPVSGLSQALRNLANEPGKFEQVLAYLLPKLGLATDPLVISRLATISKPFAGGAAAAYLTNELIDFINSANVGSAIYDWTHVDPLVNTATKAFATYQPPAPPPPPPDPLVLDLDGGGIAPTFVNTLAPIYFDMDADGIRTATGWLKPGEAIVVRDLNGNGFIDSGRELFGDQTILTRGPRVGQLAQNGFEAIADLDSNQDGKFDASDAAFNTVKLWKDLNQNAVSEAGELFAFGQLGVQSINTAYSSSFVSQDGQNWQIASGTFARSPGPAVTTGLAASFVLQNISFYSEYISNPVLTAAAKGSAQMNGSGWVRDLREAMSMGTPAAATLQAKVNAFAAATTQSAQKAMVEEIVLAWSETAARSLRAGTGISSNSSAGFDHDFTFQTFVGDWRIDFGNVFGAALDAKGYNWRVVDAGGQDGAQTLGIMLVNAGLVKGWSGGQYIGNSQRLQTWSQTAGELFAQTNPVTATKVRALEAFNGDRILDRFVVAWNTVQDQPVSWRVTSMNSEHLGLLDNAYSALKETIYAGLVVQTRLKPYLDSISLVIDGNGVRFDTATALALIQSKSATSRLDAFADALDLRKYSGEMLRGIGWDVNYTVKALVDAGPVSTSIQSLLTAAQFRVGGPTETNFTSAGHPFGAAVSDVALFGNELANVMTGNTNRDFLYGMDGNDTLQASGDNDFLDGGEGNDTLGVISPQDRRTTFIGGKGDDVIKGSFYQNTYIFNVGDGKDTINNVDSGAAGHELKLGTGIAVADVTATRAGVDLVLRFANGTDRITVLKWFADVNGSNQIEKINFADGTTWTNAQVTLNSVVMQAAVSDFDADGKSDLFWRNSSTGADVVWKAGNVLSPQAVTSVAANWRVAGAADFDGDGKADILWRDTISGANAVWRSADSAQTQTVSSVGDLSWKIAGIGDFDGDTKADILWRNIVSGSDVIWKSGNSAAGQAVSSVADQSWKVAGIGDFDGDSKDDILWRNFLSGANVIWKSANSATGQAVDAVSDLNWKVVGLGDFNGDGRDDILWRNATTGANAIWNAGSSASSLVINPVADLNYAVAAVGDYNGDGRADIAWRNASTGNSVIWGAGNSSTPITLVGVADINWTNPAQTGTWVDAAGVYAV